MAHRPTEHVQIHKHKYHTKYVFVNLRLQCIIVHGYHSMYMDTMIPHS